MRFKNLHQQNAPLIICNVWDVPSTKIAEQLNFQAIGTSSSAIAKLLGYDDGEKISFPELEFMIKSIALNTNLPLSVDLESGYSSKPKEIAENIKRLFNLGVVGINIEDSIVKNKREILNPDEFSRTLSEIKELLVKGNINIFINVRTDAFLLGYSNAVEETKLRIKRYENVGANGIFTPCIVNQFDIKEIVNSTDLPINVMCMPNLPNFDTLSKLGVKRISMGSFLFDKMYSDLERRIKSVIDDKSFHSIF